MSSMSETHLHRPLSASANRARMRELVVVGLLASLWLLAIPETARAGWDNSTEIVRGSAQVLEKGEIAIGIFAPLQFGLTDRLTIASHPVLNLLQMLNFSSRYRIRTGDNWIVAATGGFKYALLDAETTDRPFEMDLGAIFTWLPHRRLAGSLTLTYSPQIQRSEGSSISVIGGANESNEQAYHNGLALIATGHLIVHDKHLVMATLRVLRNITREDWAVPTMTVAWISHHTSFLGGVDVVLGAAFGSFRIRDPVLFASGSNTDVAESAWYPVFDIWKRF